MTPNQISLYRLSEEYVEEVFADIEDVMVEYGIWENMINAHQAVNRMHRIARQTGDPEHWAEYGRCEEAVERSLDHALTFVLMCRHQPLEGDGDQAT